MSTYSLTGNDTSPTWTGRIAPEMLLLAVDAGGGYVGLCAPRGLLHERTACWAWDGGSKGPDSIQRPSRHGLQGIGVKCGRRGCSMPLPKRRREVAGQKGRTGGPQWHRQRWCRGLRGRGRGRRGGDGGAQRPRPAFHRLDEAGGRGLWPRGTWEMIGLGQMNGRLCSRWRARHQLTGKRGPGTVSPSIE